jgi:hypothetical protein
MFAPNYDLTSGIIAPYMLVPSETNENISTLFAADVKVGATFAVNLYCLPNVNVLPPDVFCCTTKICCIG